MSCFAVYAQDKYTGIDTDCDQSMMPNSNSYKVIFLQQNIDKEISTQEQQSIPLPCVILYQIEQKRKDYETVDWQINGNTIIRIFPRYSKDQTLLTE